MKLTRHNGRSGKHGTYNPKHNDRTFDVSNSEHIDEERAKHNVYWDCFNGYRTFAEKQVQSELADTFEEVEELFYSAKYGAYVEAQNARNDKNRHSERNRTTTDLLKDKRTCPEETIYQMTGTKRRLPVRSRGRKSRVFDEPPNTHCRLRSAGCVS